jgi:AraC-like DNA-binding protein
MEQHLLLPLRQLPELVLAGRFPNGQREWSYQFRNPDRHQLHWYGYAGRIRLGGREHPLRPGDLTITPAGYDLAWDLPRPGWHWCLHFRTAAHAGPATRLPLVQHPPAAGLVDGFLALARLARIADGGAAVAHAAADAALLGFLLRLAQPTGEAATPAQGGRLAQAALTAARRIDERPEAALDLSALATALGVSQPRLARAFRRRFGCTIQAYQLRQRIAGACRLLRDSSLPVGRVGELVGFADPHHFNKRFRACVGTAPRAYRISGAQPTAGG